MELLNKKITVSQAPHIKTSEDTKAIMFDVIIALIPSLIAGTVFMGYRAAILAFVCIISSVFFEWLWGKLLKKPCSIGDLSAVVTGFILALNLPVTLPFWMAVFGSFFAIIIVKQFFGGLGHNFMNPALAGRAFLLASFPKMMTTWISPFGKIYLFGNNEIVSSATPLAALKEGSAPLASYFDLFIGNVGGSVGEISALAILIGGVYLLVKKVIDIRIPLVYIFTVFALSYLTGKDGVYQILSGGLLFGAFFMATDYVTTPFTKGGQIIFAFGCGLLTFVIRTWGGYPEGVSYSILLMNVATPLIDKFVIPKSFGQKGERKNA